MRLREYLRAREIDPKDFAELIGVRPATLARYLARAVKPSLDVVYRIYLATGHAVSAHELLLEFADPASTFRVTPRRMRRAGAGA